MCRTTNIHTVTSCPQTNLESGLQQLHLAEDAAVLWLTAYIPRTHMRTSCHSTDSKMPHGCHHLQNNFGLHRILPILHNGPRDAPQNCTFPCGESRPSPSTLFFFLESTPQTGSSAAHCCDRRTHTQTTLHL